MSDPRVGSLDIETYGKHSARPAQTCFNPRRSLFVDRVPLPSQVITVSLTLPTEDPRDPANPVWNALALSRLRPGPTMALRFDSTHDMKWLCHWLEYLDTLLGMNLPFDLCYLRARHPFLRDLLHGRHTIIDLSYVNYQDSEMRPERSLKNIGPVKGVYRYNDEDLQRLPTFEQILAYNGEDTHNAILAIAACATDIVAKNAARPALYEKLSPYAISFYSSLIWSVVAMTENGVPFHRPSLERLASSLLATINLATRTCAQPHHAVLLGGEGSKKSKAALLDRVTAAIDAAAPSLPSILNHPLLRFTDVQHDVAFDIRNQNLLLAHLPKDSPLRLTLRWVRKHAEAQKLLSTYCYPLLWRHRSLKDGVPNRKSVLVPQPGVPLPCPAILPPPTPPSDPSPPSSTATSRSTASSSSTSTPSRTSTTRPRGRSSKARKPRPSPSSAPSPPSTAPSPPSSSPSPPPASPPSPPAPTPLAICTEPATVFTAPDEPSYPGPTRTWNHTPTTSPSPMPPWPAPSSAPPATAPSASPAPGPGKPASSSPSWPSRSRGTASTASSPSPCSSTAPTLWPCSSPSPPPTPSSPPPTGPTTSWPRPRPPTPGTPNPEVWLSHPSWFIVPTATKDDAGSMGGTLQVRITCKDFQHQTDPEEIVACRQSRFHGGCLAEMDLDQAELRTGALLSGEESLMGAFLRDEDVHTRRALAIWGHDPLVAAYPVLAAHPVDNWKNVCPPFKELNRDVGKHVNFADFFWASAETIQATILKMSGNVVPLSILQHAVSRRPIDRPQLWAWQNAQLALAKAQGYIALPFLGSSRYFSGGTKDESSEIINFPIQATAAAALVFIKLALRPLLPPTILLCLNVYDSMLFDLRYPARDLPLLKELIARAVEEVTTRGYWARLQDHYGRVVPLRYKLTAKDPSP
jgi:hypothetical protein